MGIWTKQKQWKCHDLYLSLVFIIGLPFWGNSQQCMYPSFWLMKCTLRLFVPVVLNVQFSVSVRRKILRRLNNNSIMRVNVNILVIVVPFTKFSTVEDAEEGPGSPLIWGKKKERKKEKPAGMQGKQKINRLPHSLRKQKLANAS